MKNECDNQLFKFTSKMERFDMVHGSISDSVWTMTGDLWNRLEGRRKLRSGRAFPK